MNDNLIKKISEELKNEVLTARSYIFQGLTTIGYCFKVIDGDTIKCVIKYNNEFLKVTVRFDGVDTAEKKSKNPLEESLAKKASEFTKNLLENRTVKLIFLKTDKYGRHLCNVYQISDVKTGASVSEQLIEKNLANTYNGGTKSNFESLC